MQNLILDLFNINSEDIDLFTTSNQDSSVICTIRLKKKDLFCPVCGKRLSLNGCVIKNVSHQVLTGRNTQLIYQARRYRCTNCGHSEFEKNPFAYKGFRTSTFVMDQIMRDLHNPRINYTMIAQKYHLSTNQVIRYFDSFVGIPRYSLPESLGIDEIHSKMAKRKGASYLGILIDNDHFSLLDVLPSRNKSDLNTFFLSFSEKERLNVKYVTIDMWEPYRDIAHRWLKNAVVAVDPFHVIEHLSNDFSKVRIRIMNSYIKGSRGYYLLKSWNRLLMSDKYDLDGPKKYNHVFHTKLNYGDILKMILDLSDELALAYNLKEWYRRFNRDFSFETAPSELDALIHAFQRSGIKEYEEFTNLLIHWKEEIINSFLFSDISGLRLSNARTESMNNSIRTNICISNGLSNFRRFRARMIYCFNDHVFYSLSSSLHSFKTNKH